MTPRKFSYLNYVQTTLSSSILNYPRSGESPSSSASDVDNLNHQATADKAASAKVVGSPQVSGSHIITSRNLAGLLRVLNFVSI